MSAQVHGAVVSFGPAAVLITGASGTGKSALALQLMSMGATLVADDQVGLVRTEDLVIASPVPGLEGRIEARGIGIIRTEWTPRAVLRLVADLDTSPDTRLPDPKTRTYLGRDLPLVEVAGLQGAAPALRAILTGGLEVAGQAKFMQD
ncbi:MAG: HPr kinase/phosphatase C-terminal domain-containing protein [Pseudomonadota bacterium]